MVVLKNAPRSAKELTIQETVAPMTAPTTVMIHRLQLGLSALLLAGLAGCGSLAQLGIGTTPIKRVKQEWHRYSKVYIQGKVVMQVNLVESWVYKVQDSTGAIWVLTDQPLPRPGDQVSIEAKVQYEPIPLGNQDLGEAYLQEQVRLGTKPASVGAQE